jgi:hypothetical protein
MPSINSSFCVDSRGLQIAQPSSGRRSPSTLSSFMRPSYGLRAGGRRDDALRESRTVASHRELILCDTVVFRCVKRQHCHLISALRRCSVVPGLCLTVRGVRRRSHRTCHILGVLFHEGASTSLENRSDHLASANGGAKCCQNCGISREILESARARGTTRSPTRKAR